MSQNFCLLFYTLTPFTEDLAASGKHKRLETQQSQNKFTLEKKGQTGKLGKFLIKPFLLGSCNVSSFPKVRIFKARDIMFLKREATQ